MTEETDETFIRRCSFWPIPCVVGMSSQSGTTCEVKFTEWTAAGEMRHPAYLRLREDKRSEEVVRETELPRKPRAKRTKP
jgi:ATP-dependent DNA ligase